MSGENASKPPPVCSPKLAAVYRQPIAGSIYHHSGVLLTASNEADTSPLSKDRSAANLKMKTHSLNHLRQSHIVIVM